MPISCFFCASKEILTQNVAIPSCFRSIKPIVSEHWNGGYYWTIPSYLGSINPIVSEY